MIGANATVWVALGSRPPGGPRKLKITCGATSLTHYGGVYLLHRFFSRLRLRQVLPQEARLLQRNTRSRAGAMLLALRYPRLLGLDRSETTPLLRQNGVFQSLPGLPSYPEAPTLRRFLRRVAPGGLPRLRALYDRLLHRMTVRPHPPTRLIFDVDATVRGLYGKHEGAKIGDNPSKRGRPSYHPLRCFEGRTKDFWHGEWRPGDAHTASGTLERFPACFATLPAGVRSVSVRADKGVYDPTLGEWLEAHRARCVMVARRTAPITRTLPPRRYVSPSRGVEGAEFRDHPIRWPQPFRCVGIRRPQPEAPTEPLPRCKLGTYHSPVLVTNLPLQPLTRWRCYHDRAGVELLIKPLHGDYALGSIPTRHFFANETSFPLLLLAYNLVNWFKRLGLPPDLQNATLQTLRHKILRLPAQLRRVENRPSLTLPASGPREAAWRYAVPKIEKLNL